MSYCLSVTSATIADHTQGFVHPDGVAVDEVETQVMQVVLDFLAEGVGQAGETPHTHPCRPVVALGVGRADVSTFGIACNHPLPGSYALGRRILALMATLLCWFSIWFHQLSEVHVAAERAFHSLQVSVMTVNGDLHPVSQPRVNRP